MKAWLIDRFEGIEHARLADAPEPQPAAGEVMLKLSRAALNPADAYLALGQYPAKPPLPHVLGRDGVGKVVSVGTEVSSLKVGETRLILRGETGVSRWGTFAQYVSVAESYLVHTPDGWTDEQAAAAPLVYLTAYQALTQWSDLPERSVVLITGASGGVGVAAIQLCRAMGHLPIALSRSAEKCAELIRLGAAFAFDPAQDKWRDLLLKAAGARVDLAIDNVGGEGFNELLASLADRGRVSVVGRLAGPVPNFNTASLFFRRIKIGGVAVGAYTNDECRAAWLKVVELLAASGARPVIDRVFPFSNLPAAFTRLHEGPMGKVVLSID